MKANLAGLFRISQKWLFPFTLSTPKTGDTPSPYSNRQVRIAVSVFFFCIGLCFASWASRIPDIKIALGLSKASLGTILLALPAGQLSAMPFSGRLVTHYGSKKVLRIGLVLYAIAVTNLGLAEAPWQLALALYIFGVCGNLCNISVNTQAIRAEKLYGRPIMTSFHGAWSIAGFTGAGIGWFMTARHVSPYLHFVIVASAVIITVLFTQKFLQWGRSSIKPEKRSFFSRPDKRLVHLGIIAFCSMASEGAMFEWSGVYFREVVEAPVNLVVLGYSSFMIMMATGRFAGDRLIEHFGRKKSLQASGVLITIGLFTAALFPNIITATIGFLVVGLGVSSIVPMVYSAAGKVPGIPPGIALATVSSISFLGFLMGPPLIGYIAEISSLRYSFALIGLLGIAIAVLVTKLKSLH